MFTFAVLVKCLARQTVTSSSTKTLSLSGCLAGRGAYVCVVCGIVLLWTKMGAQTQQLQLVLIWHLAKNLVSSRVCWRSNNIVCIIWDSQCVYCIHGQVEREDGWWTVLLSYSVILPYHLGLICWATSRKPAAISGPCVYTTFTATGLANYKEWMCNVCICNIAPCVVIFCYY